MSNDAKKRELSKDQKQAMLRERAQRNRTIRDIFNLFPSQLEVSEMKEVLEAKGVFFDDSDSPQTLRKLLTENVNTPVEEVKVEEVKVEEVKVEEVKVEEVKTETPKKTVTNTKKATSSLV